MRVIVTGASGFLGKAVLKKLLSEKFECIGVSRGRYDGLIQVPDYVNSPEGDVLIHLAEINDRMLVNKSSNNYEYEASRVLNALINKGYSKIIYSSSAIVYGDNSFLPRKETDPVIAMDTYTRIKLKNEYSILSKAGLVLRFSNVYGPSMSPNNVLSSILRQLTSGELIRLNNLNSIRDFIWVEDAANAILNLIEPPIQGLFNIGSGVGTSISEIVQTILKASGQSHRKIVSETINPKESCIVLDISKILNQTEWSPSLSISQGLNRLININ